MENINYRGFVINHNTMTGLYYAELLDASDRSAPKILFREKSKILNYLKLKIDMYLSL